MTLFLDENSAPVLAHSPLCKICSALDLHQMFHKGVRESHSIALGALATTLTKKHICDLCGLISHLISRSWRLDCHTSEDFTSVKVQLLVRPCGWADSSQNVLRTARAHRIQIYAKRPIAIHITIMKEKISLTMDLQMMESDAVRLGRERAYHGGRVGAVVNFKLIKEWMRICDEEHGPTCASVWKNVTQQLSQGARMIDVVQMAIVGVPQNCKYVALSYTWGIQDGPVRRIVMGRQQLEVCSPLQTDKYRWPSSPSASLLVKEAASLAPGILLFYTTFALLRVRKVNNQVNEITGEDQSQEPGYGSMFHSVFEILSETSSPLAKMGRIVLPTDTDTAVPLEFAVLSRSSMGCGPETFDEQVFGIRYEGCFLNVMVVKLGYAMDGKEVSERLGVGVIVEAAWVASRFRERVVRLQ